MATAMDQLVEQILHSPRMPLYVEQLNEAQRKEQIDRAKFIDEVREDQKAEFINGEPIVHSPVRYEHNRSRRMLMRLVSTYVDSRSMGCVQDEKAMVSLTRNDYEPDIEFWHSQKSAAFKPNQMRFPAPDWIVEVLSPSTEQIDRGIKFEDYAAHGVVEYWIVDAEKQIVEQYKLTDGSYQLLLKSGSGTVRSEVIEGFEIPIVAIFDDAENLAALKKLLA
jgi:Uma2 family endonuclease